MNYLDTVTVPSREEYLSDWDGGLWARIDGGCPEVSSPFQNSDLWLGRWFLERTCWGGIRRERLLPWAGRRQAGFMVRQPWKQRKEW